MGQIHQEQNHIDSAREAYKQGVRNGIRKTLQFLHLRWTNLRGPQIESHFFHIEFLLQAQDLNQFFWLCFLTNVFTSFYRQKNVPVPFPFGCYSQDLKRTQVWEREIWVLTSFTPSGKHHSRDIEKSNFHVATKLGVILRWHSIVLRLSRSLTIRVTRVRFLFRSSKLPKPECHLS